MRKLAFTTCKKKGADRQRGNRAADQRLYFRYIDSTISLLPKFEMSSILQYHLLWPYSPVSVENPEDGFCRNAAHSRQHVVLSVSLLFAYGIYYSFLFVGRLRQIIEYNLHNYTNYKKITCPWL